MAYASLFEKPFTINQKTASQTQILDQNTLRVV